MCASIWGWCEHPEVCAGILGSVWASSGWCELNHSSYAGRGSAVPVNFSSFWPSWSSCSWLALVSEPWGRGSAEQVLDRIHGFQVLIVGPSSLACWWRPTMHPFLPLSLLVSSSLLTSLGDGSYFQALEDREGSRSPLEVRAHEPPLGAGEK